MGVVINPGSGPTQGATTRENAQDNALALMIDAQVFDGAALEVGEQVGMSGRYAFVVHRTGRSVRVEVPGLPLDRVRWTGAPGENIFDYPRLYVDDSSWAWRFAGEMLRYLLTREDVE